jgi:hypothetical protein
VLAALRAEITGFEVQDHDVELSSADPVLRADWVGTDRAGRIVLAAVRDGPDDAAILWAVEALAFARRLEMQEPARPMTPAFGPPRGPLVALIVLQCSERLLSALAMLPYEALALFELRGVEKGGLEKGKRESGARSQPWLERRDLRTTTGGDAEPDAGIETWPAAARAMAESLAARMSRIDPALEGASSAYGLNWGWRGEECAGLTLSAGVLLGACAPSGDPRLIADESSAEAWLEQVMRAHCARLRSQTGVARPADLLARGKPLLSAEELAAFREDG